MFGILHRGVPQHIMNEDSEQAPFEFNASVQPYRILVETFPSALAFFSSLVKHRWLDLHTACGHDGELQKHKMLANNGEKTQG